jgi:hypothetical protein
MWGKSLGVRGYCCADRRRRRGGLGGGALLRRRSNNSTASRVIRHCGRADSAARS